ncbi:MAG: hypothetical protein RBS27_07855, partial [Giesbergeria sp.]|nr:hypothetical protein [Giesbergeria sp.]
MPLALAVQASAAIKKMQKGTGIVMYRCLFAWQLSRQIGRRPCGSIQPAVLDNLNENGLRRLMVKRRQLLKAEQNGCSHSAGLHSDLHV